MAVICCSSDISAARKFCGHVFTLVSCHRCYKQIIVEISQILVNSIIWMNGSYRKIWTNIGEMLNSEDYADLKMKESAMLLKTMYIGRKCYNYYTITQLDI